MRALRLAISFLTIFPVYGNRVADEKEMARSLYFYPVAGFLLGGFLCLAAWGSARLNLGLAGDVVILVFWVLLSGGLHLDGLMDTADGLFSGQPRERKLEIMKDSRVGAMGVLALVCLFLLKLSFLSLIDAPDKYRVLLLAPALGRGMMLMPVAYYPYARSGPGLGRAFGSSASRLAFPAALLLIGTAGWALQQNTLLVGSLAAVLLAGLVVWGLDRILGGHTGDTYGATCEVSEMLFIAATAIAMHA